MIHKLNYLDFLARVSKLDVHRDHHRDAWSGGLDKCEAEAMAHSGNIAYATKAQTYIDQLEGIDLPEIRRAAWSRSPMGAFPCVPDYLGNSPTPMRQRVKLISDTAPLRIFTTISCASFRTADDMVNRGSGILALALLINRVRPVELYVICDTTGGTSEDPCDILCIEVPSKPLSLAHAAFIFGHPAFTRILCFSYAHSVFGCPANIPLARDTKDNPDPILGAFRRQALELTSEDIYLPIAEADHWREMMTDVPAWIRGQVAKHTTSL